MIHPGWFVAAAAIVIAGGVVFLLRRCQARRLAELAAAQGRLHDALAAAEEEKGRHRAILEALGDGISVQEAGFVITYQNPVHRRLFGDLVGRSCLELYAGAGRPCPGCPLQDPAGGAVRHRQALVHGAQGPLFVEITSSPIPARQAGTGGCVGVVRDVTTARRMSLAVETIAEGTSGMVGEDFFVSLVRHLAGGLGYSSALLLAAGAESGQGLEVKAWWDQDRFRDPCTIQAAGTIWQEIMAARHGLSRRGPFAGLFPVPDPPAVAMLAGVPVRDSSDQVIGVLAVLHCRETATPPAHFDILRLYASRAGAELERLRLEAEQQALQSQLLQAQKMESIGILAGGVAHDFNNLLSTIIGYGQMLLRRMAEDDPYRAEVEAITTAGRRAARLTRQLLAFSRKQVLEIRPLEINEVVDGVAKMLRRLIGEDIILELDLGASLPPVQADAGQLEQVLMNLAVNARDAMPGGGTLRITTAAGRPPAELCRQYPSLQDQECVVITVEDSGQGMEPAVLAKIFEPFFTTKPQGKGTGLGLATVYGIVRQHNGVIDVDSRPGAGSRFRIFLPRAAAPVQPLVPPAQQPAQAAGPAAARILVAEDEFLVRHFVTDCLRAEGYEVLAAGDGEEALRLCDTVKGIDLVLTDVVMPRMNGRELAAKVTRRFPRARVLYLSGYAEEVLDGIPPAEIQRLLVKKPVSPEELAARVRRALAA